MKKFLLNSTLLLCTLIVGVIPAWGATYSLTPNQTSTGSISTSYITTLTEFTYSGISWKMNQWNPSSLQIRANQSSASSEFRFYNTSAFPGKITKVVITFSTLTVSDASKLMFLGGTSEVTATAGGTAGTWDSSKKTLTWTPGGSDNFTYFAFYQNGAAASGSNFLASSDAIVVTYVSSKTETSLEWSEDSYTARKAGENTFPTLTKKPSSLTGISYSSSDDDIATINSSGEITLKDYGVCIITATKGEDDTYESSSASYTLIVADDNIAVETFTSSDFSATSTTYANTENLIKIAQYYANTSQNSGIALRATSPSGMVSTKSPGLVKKVIVSWNENTVKDRQIDVYGKNTAYSTPSDLFTASTQGTKAGTIYYKTTINAVETTTTTYEFSTDYNYVGLRSNSNALYLNQIIIIWELDHYAPSKITFTAQNSDGYWATFSNSHDVFIDGETAEVNIVSVNESNLELSNVSKSSNVYVNGITKSGYYVPANSGVLINSESSDIDYWIVDHLSVSELSSENKLRASSVDMENSGYKFYKLAYSDSNKTPSSLGFYYGEENGASFEIGVNKAYLAIYTGSGEAPTYFLFNDDADKATDIKALETFNLVNKFFQNGQLLILRDGIIYDLLGRIVK